MRHRPLCGPYTYLWPLPHRHEACWKKLARLVMGGCKSAKRKLSGDRPKEWCSWKARIPVSRVERGEQGMNASRKVDACDVAESELPSARWKKGRRTEWNEIEYHRHSKWTKIAIITGCQIKRWWDDRTAENWDRSAMKPDEGSPREGHVPNLLSENHQEARRLERYISIYVLYVAPCTRKKKT